MWSRHAISQSVCDSTRSVLSIAGDDLPRLQQAFSRVGLADDMRYPPAQAMRHTHQGRVSVTIAGAADLVAGATQQGLSEPSSSLLF
jgi:hypothetical protein